MSTFGDWASVFCIIMLSISILLDPNTGRIAALKREVEKQQVIINELVEQQAKYMKTQHILVEK